MSLGFWNGLDGPLIFPSQILRDTGGGLDFAITITAQVGGESRNEDTSKDYTFISIGGALLSEAQLKEWNAFLRLLKGPLETFLFLDRRECKAKNDIFGTGDGVTKTFQLQTTTLVQGRTSSVPVLYPCHQYPARYFPSGRLYRDVQSVQIWGNGTLLNNWTLDRLTGMVTFAAPIAPGVVLTWSGEFFKRLRFVGRIPVKPLGGGTYELSSGELVEPVGGV